MIVEYIRYEVPSASRDAIVEAYRSAGQELAASAQCLREMKHHRVVAGGPGGSAQ